MQGLRREEGQPTPASSAWAIADARLLLVVDREGHLEDALPATDAEGARGCSRRQPRTARRRRRGRPAGPSRRRRPSRLRGSRGRGLGEPSRVSSSLSVVMNAQATLARAGAGDVGDVDAAGSEGSRKMGELAGTVVELDHELASHDRLLRPGGSRLAPRQLARAASVRGTECRRVPISPRRVTDVHGTRQCHVARPGDTIGRVFGIESPRVGLSIGTARRTRLRGTSGNRGSPDAFVVLAGPEGFEPPTY